MSSRNGIAPQRRSNDIETNERTPLLRKEEDDKLPMGQLGLLCLARIVEPWAFFSIFPFINQMTAETGIPAGQVGFYVGCIESIFCAVQFVIMPFWGRFSDSRGRKPLLVLSLFALAITSTLFGFARNVWLMIAFRAASGIFSGCNVSIRTMVSEISTRKTQARAFSLWAFSGTIAIFFAPLLGGFLAKPADHFKLFKHFELFKAYPYLLPCMTTGAISLVAAFACMFGLKETLNTKKPEGNSSAPMANLTTKEIFQAPGVWIVTVIYTVTFILAFSYMALVPVFQFTPIELGGYAFSPSDISYFLAISGGSQAFWNLLVYPYLHSKLGNRGIFLLAAPTWIIIFSASILLNVILRKDPNFSGTWPMIAGIAFIGAGISMSYNSATLALNDIAPSPSSLGTLNGVSLSISAAVKAVSPASITAIYATGVSHHILWNQLAFGLMILIAIVYLVLIFFLPKQAWGLPDSKSAIEEAEEDEVPPMRQEAPLAARTRRESVLAGASGFSIDLKREGRQIE